MTSEASGATSPPPGAGTSAPHPRTARLPRTARRAQLLAAAQTLFASQGYRGASMEDIAQHAGVSKPVLYQHFPGKLALFLAVLDEEIGALVERLRVAVQSPTDNRRRVRDAVAVYFDFADEHSDAFRLLFGTDLYSDPQAWQLVQGHFARIVTQTASSIALDTGRSPEEAQLMAAGLTGLADVSARWWLEHRETIDRDVAVDLMSNLVWRGVSAFPVQVERDEPVVAPTA